MLHFVARKQTRECGDFFKLYSFKAQILISQSDLPPILMFLLLFTKT